MGITATTTETRISASCHECLAGIAVPRTYPGQRRIFAWWKEHRCIKCFTCGDTGRMVEFEKVHNYPGDIAIPYPIGVTPCPDCDGRPDVRFDRYVLNDRITASGPPPERTGT